MGRRGRETKRHRELVFTGQDLPPPGPTRDQEYPEVLGVIVESGLTGEGEEAGEGFTLPMVHRSEPESLHKAPHVEQAYCSSPTRCSVALQHSVIGSPGAGTRVLRGERESITI